MPDNVLAYCSFCNTHKDSVTKLIVSDNVAICSDCIELCNQLIAEDTFALAVKPNKPDAL